MALAGFLTAIFSRFFVATLGLPSFLNFLHFPLIVASFLLTKHCPIREVKQMLYAIVGFLTIVLFSGTVNGTEPARILSATILWIEPVLLVYVVWGSLASDPHLRRQRWGEIAFTAAVGAQIVVMTFQIPASRLFAGGNDTMQGTFLDSATGAHVAPAVAILGAMLLVEHATRGGRGSALALVIAAYALVLGLLASAFVVTAFGLVALAIALLVSLLARVRRLRVRVLTLVSIALVGMIGFFAYPNLGATPSLEWVERGITIKRQAPDLLLRVFSRDPASAVLGLGPGTTVSRAAIETPGGTLNAGSPQSWLGLETTEFTEQAIAFQQSDPIGASSAFHSWNSLLGLLGDIGLLGLTFYVLMWAPVVLAAYRQSPLRSIAVVGSLALTLLLGATNIWLEDPGYILILGLFLGLRATGLLSPQVKRSVEHTLEQPLARNR